MLTRKPFYGDLCQYTSFREQLSAPVYVNSTLNTTEKFYYLCDYLVGEAAAAIAGLPTTEACYESAIQLLKKRCGDKSRIVQQHFRAHRELQPVTSPSDTTKLRMVYDGFPVNVRSLNVLDVPTRNFAAMLYESMLQSLFIEILVAIHCHSRLEDDENSTTPPSSEQESTAFRKKLEELLRYTQTELET
ncbi:hypothetical protein HPB50_002088 [Hyalomma asiaticum]|uniref:Uncharacterized protein n=1 Tax=Hyalomma asiaticum TaxID=266040 RepID=A0ACB7TCX4_HYAAI|nr:hypothetical protein HPB50_002088 [Hyalomma asiaticum]